MSYIYIIPIETSPLFWFEPLTAGISRVFGMRTKCVKFSMDISKAFDPLRQQYNSSHLLSRLIDRPLADADKVLGVAEVDLFIPILTFVFGEAQLEGPGAIVSMHRLNNKFYGLPENQTLLAQRIVKESIHELGHTFGLLHCSSPGCVLNSSTYVEDIDQKSEELCPQCQQQINIT
jgi:archaemetzincin